MNDLLGAAAAVAFACIGCLILKSQRPLVLGGRGWIWTLASGLYAFFPWLGSWVFDVSLIVPAAITVAFLLALVGSVPDDESDGALAARSRWFRRGLAFAVAGAIAGMVSWA